MKRSIQWLCVILCPFVVVTAYLVASRRTVDHADTDLDFLAIAVGVLVGVAALFRVARTDDDPAFWLILYVPAVTIALLFWSLVFVCSLTGDCL